MAAIEDPLPEDIEEVNSLADWVSKQINRIDGLRDKQYLNGEDLNEEIEDIELMIETRLEQASDMIDEAIASGWSRGQVLQMMKDYRDAMIEAQNIGA